MKNKIGISRMDSFFKLFFNALTIILITNLYGCAFSSPSPAHDKEEDASFASGIEEDVISVSEENRQLPNDDSGLSGNSAIERVKSPRVLIAENGYCPGDEKTAFFLNGEEGGTFLVVNADTKETVYTGRMVGDGQETSGGMRLFKGDFTLTEEEGSYYIEAPFVGRSYTFRIEENHLEGIKERLLSAMEEEAESPTGVFLYRAQSLLWMLRYEDFYGKEETLAEGTIPEIIQQARMLGDALIEKKDEQGEIADKAFYCAAMAQLYEALKPYDERGAAVYLREAENSYRQLEGRRFEDEVEAVWLFFDASVIYHATGNGVYHNVLRNYLNESSTENLLCRGASEEQILKDEAYIYGAVAYLTNTHQVDVNLCDRLIEELLNETRAMANEHGSHPYLCISDDLRNRLLSDRLYTIAVMEHTIVSKEYVQILKDGINYIDGCNETGRHFLTGKGILDESRDEKYSDAPIGGAYLFVLGEIMESEAEK